MLQRPAPRLILASASASRRALLTAAGLTLRGPAGTDRRGRGEATARASGATATEAALLLADLKARPSPRRRRMRW